MVVRETWKALGTIVLATVGVFAFLDYADTAWFEGEGLALVDAGWPADTSGWETGTGAVDTPPPAVCFAPDTPKEVIEEFTDTFSAEYGPEAYFLGGRWPGSQGSPKTLTWSFVPDGLTIPAAGSWDNNGQSGPSELFSRMDALFGGNRALWISQFQQVFDRITIPGVRHALGETIRRRIREYQ